MPKFVLQHNAPVFKTISDKITDMQATCAALRIGGMCRVKAVYISCDAAEEITGSRWEQWDHRAIRPFGEMFGLPIACIDTLDKDEVLFAFE